MLAVNGVARCAGEHSYIRHEWKTTYRILLFCFYEGEKDAVEFCVALAHRPVVFSLLVLIFIYVHLVEFFS